MKTPKQVKLTKQEKELVRYALECLPTAQEQVATLFIPYKDKQFYIKRQKVSNKIISKLFSTKARKRA